MILVHMYFYIFSDEPIPQSFVTCGVTNEFGLAYGFQIKKKKENIWNLHVDFQ